MNRGFLESLQVQKMMNLTPNWWNINSSPMKPSQPQQQQQSSSPHLLPSSAAAATPPSHHLFPHHEFAHQAASLPLNSWHESSTNQEQLPVESWSQLLMGGSVVLGEEDRSGLNNYHQVVKKLENWEEQILYPPPSIHVVHHDIKQEISENAYLFALRNQGLISSTQAVAGIRPPNWSHQLMSSASSPSSCVTASTFSNNDNNMLDFSNKKSDIGRHPQPDHSSECNSTATGGTFKKARVQPSSTLSTFKVRKEKLGDRITALHQLVSPFGKTDTASVLLEAIGYIRFLQSQIEALSSPYMGNASGNMRQQQHPVQAGEKSSIFPDDPGQLLNNDTSCMKRRGTSDQDPENEPKKDLRSRGLCLVPVSCTLQVGSDNGADYWAPAALGGGFQ